MTWLDWTIVAMGVWFILQGLLKGTGIVLLGALAIILSYAVSAMAMPLVGQGIASWLMSLIRSPEFTAEWARTVGFVVTFILLYVICSLLISIAGGARQPDLPGQVLGVGVGVLKALMASMALVGVLLASPLSDGVAADLKQSLLAGSVGVMQQGMMRIVSQASPIEIPPYGADKKF